MTETEWLTCTNPQRMLEWCNDERDYRPSVHPVITDRKLRLFACACCRQVWPLLTDSRSRKAVEVAERYADGLATEDEREKAYPDELFNDPPGSPSRYAELWDRDCLIDIGPDLVCNLSQYDRDECVPPAVQANLLRDIIGNPFRPMHLVEPVDEIGYGRKHFRVPRHWLTWRDGTILRLAEEAYQERVNRLCEKCKGEGRVPAYSGMYRLGSDPCPDCHGTGTLEMGELDPGRLAIIADALEEAGCCEEVLLRHLRGQEQVPEKCWRCKGSGRDLDKLNRPHVKYMIPPNCRHCVGRGWKRETTWVPLRGPHVRGCWAIDLLRGVKC